ncbi:MAG TPA: A/G-specific adenine glycosylase [Candidatus Krumholzibacteria bacterium]|nr:A/G-specific adenine glycosylase [Candidatus Krumholzibacteria bacterium]
MEGRELPEMRRSLLRWYGRHARDLPWRRSRDPYAIWVAEIMLQQTRVDVVVPYYERFLQRYPDLLSLARAPVEDVLHAWSGLGYYSRARNLHAAARRIGARPGARMPNDRAGWQELPGVGRYTAGAIASIAFGHPEPILDGNVIRVLARLQACTQFVDAARTRNELWDVAARWARCRVPGTVNQALMELGATVCTPVAPACRVCPLRRGCRAHALRLTAELPRVRRVTKRMVVHLAAALVRTGPRLLLVRRQSGRLLHGWWEVPTLRATGRSTPTRLDRALHNRCSAQVLQLDAMPARVQHGILSHRLEIQVYTGQATRVSTQPQSRDSSPHSPAAAPLANLELRAIECRWVTASECRHLPLTTLTRKALHAASELDSTWRKYLHQAIGDERTDDGRGRPSQDDMEQSAPADGAHTLGEPDAERTSRHRL